MENIEKSKKLKTIFIIYMVILMTFIAVRICSGFGLFNALGNAVVVDIVSTAIIQILIMFFLPLLLYKLMRKKQIKNIFAEFGFKKLNFKSILICFGIGILVYVVNIFVASFFNILLSRAGYSFGGSAGGESSYTVVHFLIEIVTVAILPAICEEFVHRGLLLRGSADVVGYKKAIIISSILFGLMHLNIQQFFYATIMGVFMGFIVTMTRSIWPSIIVHFCNNFLNVYFNFASYNDLPGGGFTNLLNSLAGKNILLFIFVSLTIVIACVIGIIWLVKLLFVQNSINSYGKVFADIEQNLRANNDQITDQEVVGAFEDVVIPNMKSPKNMVDFFIADEKRYRKVSLKYKIPLIACLFLSVTITVFTFIWGCV